LFLVAGTRYAQETPSLIILNDSRREITRARHVGKLSAILTASIVFTTTTWLGVASFQAFAWGDWGTERNGCSRKEIVEVIV
jgi:hypothetical protein